MTSNAERSENIELVWGCSEIAKFIGRSSRSTFHMLSTGKLPARKIGGRWVAERSQLARFFLGAAA